MVQGRRGRRAQRPIVLLSLVLAAFFLPLSGWDRVYSEAVVDLEDDADYAALFVHPPELRRGSAFERMWADAGLAPDDGLIAEPIVFFAWASSSETATEADGYLAALPFDKVAWSPGFDLRRDRSKVLLALSEAAESETRCLASAIYFEARGEDRPGRLAVAQVILNRVKDPDYPKTICGVVYQNARNQNRCQFSFACDGVADRITDKGSWIDAMKIARTALNKDGGVLVAELDKAMYFHTVSVTPAWARNMKRTDVIGRHIFYERPRGGSS